VTFHEFSPGNDEIFKQDVDQLFRKPELLRSLDITNALRAKKPFE